MPLVRLRDGIVDPRPGIGLFGPRLHAVDELERSVELLHAICFGAKDPADVARVLHAHPEWRLSCVRYGPELSVRDAARMLRASRGDDAAGHLDVAVPEILKRFRQVLPSWREVNLVAPELAGSLVCLQAGDRKVHVYIDGHRASAKPAPATGDAVLTVSHDLPAIWAAEDLRVTCDSEPRALRAAVETLSGIAADRAVH